ncbi:hypothetical protein [Persicobacter diffluens]|uniref:hypothetical protein n=1 Tax=Persicobacter diffluens TaxID=981 RepID=UPI0030C6F5CE
MNISNVLKLSVISHTHSHPRGSGPSPADKKFAETFTKYESLQGVSLFIYQVPYKNTIEYNKDGVKN